MPGTKAMPSKSASFVFTGIAAGATLGAETSIDKVLVAAGHAMHEIEQASAHCISVGEPLLDWKALIDREKQMISHIPGALGRLIALSEAYPDLKANANFQQLAGELSDLENKIAASRRFFNNAVQEYNTGIQQMPAALFAVVLGSGQCLEQFDVLRQVSTPLLVDGERAARDHPPDGAGDADDGAAWHDPSLDIADRMKLAQACLVDIGAL